MKNFFYLFTLITLSCYGRQTDAKRSARETSWNGTLNGKTPVFMHYQVDSNVVVGQITYLNTKDKIPVRLLGTIEPDKSYRLLEFDSTGKITGIIEGTPATSAFNGTWFSPRTRKVLEMNLAPKDTFIATPSIKAVEQNIFGSYHYRYGEKGYRGDLTISKAGKGKVAFDILSLTDADSGPNIAEAEKDTVTLNGNSFIYTLGDDCAFKVTFYKNFVYIHYVKGCEGQFGMGATVDGIYVKIRDDVYDKPK